MQIGETGKAMRGQNIFLLLALAPMLGVIIPWDFGPEKSTYRTVMAGYSLTVPILQLIVYFYLSRQVRNPFLQVGSLPAIDRLAIAIMLFAVLASTLLASVFKFAVVVGALALYAQIAFTLLFFQTKQQIDDSVLANFWKLLGLSTFGFAGLWMIGFMFYPPADGDWVQRVPGVTNVRWTGFFWLAVFAAGLVFVQRAGPRLPWPALAYGVFGLTMTIWTGSRGALLAILCAGIGALIFGGMFRKRVFLYFMGTLVISFGVNTVLPVPDPHYGLARILNHTISENAEANPDSGRIELWQSTLELSENQPVFGHGIDQFQRMGPEKTLGFKGPHSWPVQVVFSVGWLGMLVFVYGIARMIVTFRLQVEKPHQLAALAFMSGGLAYMMYDNFLYYTFPIAIFIFSILMLIRPKSSKPDPVALIQPAE